MTVSKYFIPIQLKFYMNVRLVCSSYNFATPTRSFNPKAEVGFVGPFGPVHNVITQTGFGHRIGK